MRAIVLGAGLGRRLLPHTQSGPKGLVPVRGEDPLLALQLEALARGGIERACVVVGFGAERVERFLASHPVAGLSVQTLYNPFYASSDNLVSCWLARSLMDDDFLLLNGDTLFEDAVLQRLMEAPPAAITVTVDTKPEYDADDMKVALDARGRVLAIGKDLPGPTISAESIGLIAFRGSGPKVFREALERVIRRRGALSAWYLSAVDDLARSMPIESKSIQGLWWREIDSPRDLTLTRAEYVSRR